MILGIGGQAAADSIDPRLDYDSRPILIVTGLVQEARIAEGPGRTVICSSSDPKQLRAMLESFDATSIRGVISFGVAGGLDPTLNSGDVIVATDVVVGAERWTTDFSLSCELLVGADVGRSRMSRGRLVGAEKVVAQQSDKAELHTSTGAAAVDMESHIAAAFAARCGLPFAALRVISDPASRGLPEIATRAIKPNGDIDVRKVLGGLARNPTTLRALVSTGRDFNRALRSLRNCRSLLLGGVAAGLVPAQG